MNRSAQSRYWEGRWASYLSLELLELLVFRLPVLIDLLLRLVSSFFDALCSVYPVSLFVQGYL